ncbi:MAG: hypothetical protein WD534_09945 [Phycisphaeraceae bacterium]
MRGLRRAQRKLRAFGSAIRGIGTKMAGLGAAITAPLLAASKVFASTGDDLNKMAIRTGISVEALSELGFAAEQSGADLDSLAGAVLRMNRRLGRIRAGQGTATQVEAMEGLGLSAEALAKMSPEQTLSAIADAMAAMEDPTQAAGLAQRAFGTQVDRILPLLLQGSKGMNALREQARRLGLTISGESAASAAKFTDTLNILWKVVKRGIFAIGNALAPLLIEVAERITTVAVATGQWIRENKRLIVTAFKVGAAVLAAGAGLVVLGTAIVGLSAVLGIVATGLSTAATLLGALLSPIGLAATAVGVLGAVILKATGAGASALAWLGEKFTALKAIALKAWRGIADALAAGDLALAAEVLWAALKVQWLKGVNYLKGLWLGFKVNFMKVATDAFFGAVKIAASAWDGLRAAWVQTVAFLKDTWTNFTSTLASAHRRSVGFVARQLLRLRGLMDESFDAEAAITIAEQDTRADLNAIERDKQAALAASDRQREQDLARIGQENLDTLAALDRQSEAANRRRQSQAQQEIDAATQELENARREYEAALAEAAERRAQSEGDRGEGPTSLETFLDQLEGIGDRLEDAARRSVEVRGTFNAAAIQGMMASGGAAERTADATEQTARNTKRIEREIRTPNLAFA